MLVMEAERFGGPQVLTARQVPDPVAGPGQVVVRTSAADVLFVDYSEPGWAGQVRGLTAAEPHTALESRLAARLPAAARQTLTGREFFPGLISGPFQHGLVIVFVLAAVLAALAALASALRGARPPRPTGTDPPRLTRLPQLSHRPRRGTP